MNDINKITGNIKKVFSQYINNNVPKSITNILWQLFNGVEAMFWHLEMKIDILRRERNILKASSKASLRTLAANNGFEPSLKTPSKGLLAIELNTKLYNRVGYPLFIPPYAIFTCKETKLTYYYNSNKSLRLVGSFYMIPVVEGELKTITHISDKSSIQRVYFKESNIADNSFIIDVDGVNFVEVKSFYDNEGFNDNKQFMVKWGNDPQNPIILYIKGAERSQTVNISYRLTLGEVGNIAPTIKRTFETYDIINQFGDEVDLDEDVTIYNAYGFSFGSNGTDENALRSAIGYNHGSFLLYDNTSYRNFLSKFSTIILQTISPNDSRNIHEIFLSKKRCINAKDNNNIVSEYQTTLNNGIFLTDSEKKELSNILDEHEYCLSSHNINNSLLRKYAFQIKYNNIYEKDANSSKLDILLYSEFSKFLYDKNHTIDIKSLFNDYMIENNIEFEYHIFKENFDVNDIDNYLISHIDTLPILKGDFNIAQDIKLFTDINHVIK